MRLSRSSGGEHGPPFRSVLACALTALCLVLGAVSTARADTIIPVFGTVTNGPGANFTWSYKVGLQGAGGISEILSGTVGAANAPPTLANGDFFAITDVFGLDAAATLALVAPPGWVTVVENLTFNYQPPLAVDSAALPNVRWTWTGGSTLLSPQALGVFKLVSSLNTVAKTLYVGNDHKVADGSQQSNFGQVEAPNPFGPPAVPLPQTALAGAALCSLIRCGRSRQPKLN